MSFRLLKFTAVSEMKLSPPLRQMVFPMQPHLNISLFGTNASEHFGRESLFHILLHLDILNLVNFFPIQQCFFVLLTNFSHCHLCWPLVICSREIYFICFVSDINFEIHHCHFFVRFFFLTPYSGAEFAGS